MSARDAVTVAALALGGVIGTSSGSSAAPESTTVQLTRAGVAGLASNDLGGSQVTMSAVAVPIGMNQHAGEVLPSPSLGIWTAAAGASYRYTLANSSALVASWARVNGGNLNVVVTAIGSDAARHMTTTYRTTASGSSVELTTPLLGSTGHWSRAVPFLRPNDSYRPYPCSYSVVATQGGTGRVGQLAIWYDEHGSFTYGKEADTNAGVSYTDGSTGEFHISNSKIKGFYPGLAW